MDGGQAVPAGCGPARRNMLFFVHGGSSVSCVALTPALAQQIAQRARRRTFDRHHHVVERRVRRAGHHAVLVLRRVLARVPAARRQIDAAAERDRVVDDHDLLMMRAAGRMRVVVAKADPAVRLPRQAIQRRPLAVEPEDHRVIPDQDVDLQLAAAAHQVVEKVAELQLAVLAVRAQQARAAVEIPAGDQDRALRVARGLDERLEVRVRIDQERPPARRARCASNYDRPRADPCARAFPVFPPPCVAKRLRRGVGGVARLNIPCCTSTTDSMRSPAT